MDSSNNYINNTIISLEEKNSNEQNKSKIRKKYAQETSNTSSDSFLSKFFNSVSKIGQGLKNIMSMKINIEKDDDYNSNLYDQINNRFNNQEEISLIEAPSFMDDSNSYKKYSKKKEKKIRENNDNDNFNESNKMVISQNETKIINDINNNSFKELDSIDNSSLEKQKGIFNNSLLKNKDKRINIKSTLLAKKRDREEHSIINELIREEEEEKNEDEEKKDDKKRKQQKNDKSMIKNSESKSRIDISSYNISEQKKRNNNNTSIMSLSMKSLDNIKSEIEERRLKNLRSIEEMHKRHGLYYDYVKERQMREKILNEYYKEKEKRIAEDKIKMELEKKKREEEFEKLKIKKSSNFKISSLKKPKKTFSEEKNTQFHFAGKTENTISNQGVNASNNLNITFGNNSGEINNNKSIFNVSDNNKKESKSLFGNNENDSNKKEAKSLFNINENNNTKKETNSLFGNNASDNANKEDKPLFGMSNGLFGEKKTENKNENENKVNFNNKTASIFSHLIDKKNDNSQEKKDESKPNTSLFSGASGGLFSGKNIATTTTPSNSLFNFNSSGNSNNISNTEKSGGGLFNFGKEDKSNLFGTKKNIDEPSSFFRINPNQMKSTQSINMNIQKDGLFSQDTSVSKAINTNSLFTSNKPENNDQNKNDSLVNSNNPFINSANQVNQSNNKPTINLFGNSGNVGGLLFGNGNGTKKLFG